MSCKFQVLVVTLLSAAGIAQAQPAQTIEKLPMVVITGKSVQSETRVVQLPRVVVEGRSLSAQRLAAAKLATQGS